jgi:hypothetical protein
VTIERSTRAPVPDLLVERLALGELSPEEAARVREALGDEAEARLSALAKDAAELLARLPPARVAEQVRRRLAAREPAVATPSRGGLSSWIPALALGAAAAILAWLFLRPDVSPPAATPIAHNDVVVPGTDDGETVFVKGGARMWIDRIGPAGAHRLSSGDAVANGDRLQVHYDAADHELGVIVSIDGGGATTLHFPSEPDDAPTLAGGGGVALDHSYELDDAPGFERFFFVTAPRESDLDVQLVLASARELASTPAARTAPLRLPAPLGQTSILLSKGR